MRVLQFYQIDWHNPGLGGGIRYVKLLTQGLMQNGLHCTVLGAGGRKTHIGGLSYVPVSRKATSHNEFLLWTFYYVLRHRLKFDIVHFHRAYHVWPLLFVRGKKIVSLHGRTFSLAEDRFGKLFRLIKPFYMTVERLSLSLCDEIVFVSEDVQKVFTQRYPKLLASKQAVIGSMIELDSLMSVPLLPREDGKNIVLSLGRLAEVKNLQLYIDVAREFKDSEDYEFWIVGQGELEKALKEYAGDLIESGKLKFLGAIDPDRVPEILEKSKYLLLTSRHEASPTVVKEALAAGVAVISTDVGDVNFYLNGRNGAVVKSDVHSFKSKLLDFDRLSISKENIRAESIEKLSLVSPSRVSEEYIKLYMTR